MVKRATETKEGYPCFLTPSLLADQSLRTLNKQQATPGEATNLLYMRYDNSYYTIIINYLEFKNDLKNK